VNVWGCVRVQVYKYTYIYVSEYPCYSLSQRGVTELTVFICCALFGLA